MSTVYTQGQIFRPWELLTLLEDAQPGFWIYHRGNDEFIHYLTSEGLKKNHPKFGLPNDSEIIVSPETHEFLKSKS